MNSQNREQHMSMLARASRIAGRQGGFRERTHYLTAAELAPHGTTIVAATFPGGVRRAGISSGAWVVRNSVKEDDPGVR